METLPPRILCIGLARVDVIANVSEDFLLSHGMAKGASNFLDACTTGAILSRLDSPVCCAGGNAANTACGIAESGVPVRFVGKTGDDGYGDIFRAGFARTNVIFDTAPNPAKMTSVCLTLVTPDKKQTFAFCGDTAGWFVGPDDLPESADECCVYIEAHAGLIPAGGGRTLLEEAAQRYQDMPLILNLHDCAVVARCRADIGALLARAAPTCMTGSLSEVHALFQTDDLDALCARVSATNAVFAVTNGAEGAYILKRHCTHHVAADLLPDNRVVNTIGASDQFAAGFVVGLVNGLDAEAACARGLRAAASVLQQVDARPKQRRMA